MQSRELGEIGRQFLARVSEYLVSLPFDLKILQEAVAEIDLERPVREMAASFVVSVILPQEGTGPERFVDDVLLLRIALARIAAEGGDGAEAFCARFDDVYGKLEEDLAIFRGYLGDDLWAWLGAKIPTFVKLARRGKRPSLYVDDQSGWDELYDEGLAFQTNYDVTEAQVQNKLRRPEQLTELLLKRHAEDSKKRS